MTRKDFQLIAQTLANFSKIRELNKEINWTEADLARNFADALATTNPNFNRARFLTACGVN